MESILVTGSHASASLSTFFLAAIAISFWALVSDDSLTLTNSGGSRGVGRACRPRTSLNPSRGMFELSRSIDRPNIRLQYT